MKKKYQLKIGERYLTQGGVTIRLVKRCEENEGFETVVDEMGVHRYDRSQGGRDCGRVTGSPHDYSNSYNIAWIPAQPK